MTTRIYVSRDATSLAFGADAVAIAIEAEARKRGIEVVVVANGQAGGVHEHGAGADQDGVACSAEPVGVSACGCGADPAGGAVGCRAAAVERGRQLPGDERSSLCVRERPGPVQRPGLLGHQTALDVDAALPQRLGAAVGTPVEHYLGRLEHLMLRGAVFILIGLAGYLAVRHIPIPGGPGEEAPPPRRFHRGCSSSRSR